MQEVFEKIIEKLKELKENELQRRDSCDEDGYGDGEQIYDDGRSKGRYEQTFRVIGIIEQAVTEYNNGWIPVEDRLPGNEEEVEITFTKKDWMTGKTLYLTARAFYENGTLTTEDSAFGWNDTDNWDIDEDTDTYLIPEGWYEGVSFTEEFGIVDMPVIAWRKLTEPYRPKGE